MSSKNINNYFFKIYLPLPFELLIYMDDMDIFFLNSQTTLHNTVDCNCKAQRRTRERERERNRMDYTMCLNFLKQTAICSQNCQTI